jgi:hypothetical protein
MCLRLVDQAHRQVHLICCVAASCQVPDRAPSPSLIASPCANPLSRSWWRAAISVTCRRAGHNSVTFSNGSGGPAGMRLALVELLIGGSGQVHLECPCTSAPSVTEAIQFIAGRWHHGRFAVTVAVKTSASISARLPDRETWKPPTCTQLRFEVRSHARSNPWRRKKAKEEADADEPSQRSLGSRLGLPRHAV